MTAREAALAFVVFLLSAESRAAGLPGSPAGLVLRVPSADCATAPNFTPLVDALQVELAATGPACCLVEPRGEPPHPGAIALDVDPCDASADEVTVTIEEAGGTSHETGAGAPAGEASRRRISLADVRPEARPRALALAVAELVRSAPRVPAAVPSPAPRPVAPPSVPAGPGLRWGSTLAVDALLRAEPALDTLLGGGRLALAAFGERWVGAIDADVTAGNRSVDLGSLHVRLVHAAVSAGARLPIGRAVVDLGPSAGIGWAWVTGQTTRADVHPGSGSGLVATVGWRAGIEAPTSRTLRARVAVEGGATVRRLTADVNGSAAGGISGPYVLVGVGLAIGLRAPSR